MWLDICEEMALSRLCVATREVFELPAQDYEDERLANGEFEHWIMSFETLLYVTLFSICCALTDLLHRYFSLGHRGG